ncbi:hypothetical protein DAMA08_048780 [Martiniozyma asiatica (nom. inval.)]|nr:hypothetical protein DAMA08_048780 [Martiniozyma asiatica]
MFSPFDQGETDENDHPTIEKLNPAEFTSEDNISFAATRKVQIKVRDLTVKCLINNSSKLSMKRWKVKERKNDLESNNSSKVILNPMSFNIEPNTLTCIMGGSGSGKTTLLNSLAGRQFKESSMIKNGIIKYNDKDNLSFFRHAYVIQQDVLIPTLTCFETLMYTAELKLPKLTSKQQRKKLVEEIILQLGLKECSDTLVGDNRNKGLSGGERRRLSVGLQLISNPSILFLDEPTTGLDSYNALLLCQCLKKLAKNLNKTIIMSIHQPRADIFKLFDTVLILSKGKLCYGSSYENIFDHFNSMGYCVPKIKVNPADYYVDITSVDTRTNNDEIKSLERVEKISSVWDNVMKLMTPIENEKLTIDDELDLGRESKIFQEVGRAPFWREVKILIRRNLVLQKRDPIGWFSTLSESLILALLCGWLFFKPGTSIKGIRSMESSLYQSSSLQCYLFMLYEVYRLCQLDLKVFDRERLENCISVSGWLISRRISKLITEDLFIPLIFSLITYFMYGLRLDSAKYFFKYFAGILLFHINTMCFATFAAACSRDISVATVIANLQFTFQSMTNGLFVNARTLPVYVRWCKYIAYLWYSFGYLLSNQFTDWIGECDETDVSLCYQANGEYVLSNYGFPKNWNALPICVVLAFSIGHYILAGIILKFKPVDMAMAKVRSNVIIDSSVDYEKQISMANDKKDAIETKHSPIKVILKDIDLSVNNKMRRMDKKILHSVSAEFEAGKLNIIMGPSGSGKTSLLNYISGRLSSNLNTVYSSSGQIFLDDVKIEDPLVIKSVCSYVIQEDNHLLSSLTVKETLLFSARLRLSSLNLTKNEVSLIVDDIILKMGLKDCINTLVGDELIKGISGGEKRRLSIAIQLLSSPKILFLDEPTSGLDAFTASSIIECLNKLSKSGTTIIMTIHQPRSLENFGSILLLAKGGKVAFNGNESQMISHFSKIGHPVPELTNLADFVIDIISYNTSNSELQAITLSRVNNIIENWKDNEWLNLPKSFTFMTKKTEIRERFSSIIKEPASFNIGFWVLAHRQWLGIVRNLNVLLARTTQIIGMAVIYSLFFARLRHDIASIQDRFGLIQQCCSLYFVGMLNNISSYPQERDYFYVEFNDDIVDLNSFFFSYLFIEIPFEIISCLIFSVFMIFVIGFQINAGLFFTFFYSSFLVVNAGESLGISFNTVFEHPGFALNVISIFCSIGVGMAGLLAMTLDNFLKAMNYLSPCHYSVMLISNLTFDKSLEFHCSKSEELANGSCLFSNGEQVKDAYTLGVNITLYFILFTVVTICHRAISWGFLKVKLMKINVKRWKKLVNK